MMDPNVADNSASHPTDNKASIALLRRARAGDRISFVHEIDVCDAVPEVLVADLQPVPGTCHDDDGGYSSVWYCYYAKKYKNTRGDNSGHRHRAVTGGGGTSWHSEISRKEVVGSGGGTFCTFSYGRKPKPSSKTIDRMGWCMIEYDLKQQDEAVTAAGDSNYVLCKVYRSNRAKGKSEAAAAVASSSKNAASSSSKKTTAKKRKAGGGDHPEAPPAKVIQHQQQEQEQVQQENAYFYGQLQQGLESEHDGDLFNEDFNIDDINFYVDVLQGAMLEPGLQQEQQQQPIAEPEEFTVERLLRGQPEQQPIVQPPQPAGLHSGDEFIQMPCGPVVPAVPEAMFEELGLGPEPETVYGAHQWSSGKMTTASTPWNSYAQMSSPSSSCTPWSSLLQGPNSPLQLPYLMC